MPYCILHYFRLPPGSERHWNNSTSRDLHFLPLRSIYKGPVHSSTPSSSSGVSYIRADGHNWPARCLTAMTKSLAAQRLVVVATAQAVAAMTPLPHTVGQTLIDANLSRTDETAALMFAQWRSGKCCSRE